jgi:uncharacterized membrane protein
MQPIHKARLEQFSDGVFAIAITLLAIELKVPQIVSSGLGSSTRELIPLIPNIAAFILSFITIAIFWVNHHQLTRSIETVSRRIIWANMLFLMFVTLIPFATTVLGENSHNTLSVLTYSFILFGNSTSFSILRFFVHKHEDHLHSIAMKRSVIGPIIYAGAVVASIFLSLNIAYIFLIVPPLFYFLPRN